MPEEPAIDSYQPQEDVSHAIAQLTQILTDIFVLRQVKGLFFGTSLKRNWMNHIELSCSITFSPPQPPC